MTERILMTATYRLLPALIAAAVALAACGTDDNSASQPGQRTTSGPAASSAASDPAASSSAPGGIGAGDLAFESAGFSCATGSLRSSGSTAQGAVLAELITSYNAKCGADINDYGGGGSGQGITDFLSGQTDFGGSDSAMDAAELARAKAGRCEQSDAMNLPMVTGPIAVAYRLPGIDRLVLTPAALAGIFGGEITEWNDPAIAAANPGATLPQLAITTVHRAEDSGTTDNFTRYLAAAGPWTYPGGKAWSAPGGTAAQGSDGVAKAVAETEGAIGYVEWGFARQQQLAMAEIDNGAGPVALTAESAGRAIAAATVAGPDLALQIDYATQQAGAYPIVLVTYELVCSGGNGAKAELLRSFLGYAATSGQALFADLGAAPLPESIRTEVVAAVTAMG